MPATLIIHPDGRHVARFWIPGTRPSYRWLTLAIAAPDQDGGMIEGVGGDESVGWEAWANEEGRLFDLPANVPAMRRLQWPDPPEGWDAYDGNMGNAPPFQVFGSLEEMQAAPPTWCPVVGPVVFLLGFGGLDDEGDYVDKELDGDTSLGTDSPTEIAAIMERAKREAMEREPQGAA